MRGRAQPQRCFASGACHLLGVLPWFGREGAPDEGCSARSNQAGQTLTPGRLLMFGSLAALALIAAPAPAIAVAPETPQRSEERRVGTEWVSTCRTRGST